MAVAAVTFALAASSIDWEPWVSDFGNDTWVYPDWVQEQRKACVCDVHTFRCTTTYQPKTENELSFCVAKEWMLNHMPEKDLSYLPPASSVQGTSMLDDTLAFSMMADNATAYSSQTPLALKLAYILPHSDFMDSVQNWRGLFFSKFFKYAAEAGDTKAALDTLITPKVIYTEWHTNFTLKWHSSTSPPVVSPYDFLAFGEGSCTAWAGLLVYTARSVGVPARITGAPCWNSGDWAGPASSNPNVSRCWNGGDGMFGEVGGKNLPNHNWVEIWDSKAQEWGFINSPPGNTTDLNKGWMCKDYVKGKGCCGGGGASMAAQDHPVFSYTWSQPGDLSPELEGGEIVLGSELTLTNGEAVSPLVWSPHLQDAFGRPISRFLRMVNRTSNYRCDNSTQ